MTKFFVTIVAATDVIDRYGVELSYMEGIVWTLKLTQELNFTNNAHTYTYTHLHTSGWVRTEEASQDKPDHTIRVMFN